MWTAFSWRLNSGSQGCRNTRKEAGGWSKRKDRGFTGKRTKVRERNARLNQIGVTRIDANAVARRDVGSRREFDRDAYAC